MRNFDSLTEREVLALAITLEEEHERVYSDYAEALRRDFPASAAVFQGMREEESEHRRRLIDLYRVKFGEHIPLVRREDVKGLMKQEPLWLQQPLNMDKVRKQAGIAEAEMHRFYLTAAGRSQDASIRQLLNDLAQEEVSHEHLAEDLKERQLGESEIHDEAEASKKLFLLQVVQPGLAGLMDGSVSTLAPLFAAAFATKSTHDALAVGLAASLGAGISMGFAEALSDDGSLTGRGHPLLRGLVCGIMTTVGGIGHTLPYLIHDFNTATTVAAFVVLVELGVIATIRHKYMATPLLPATMQVVLGGLLVFATGVLIGSS